MGQVAAGRGNGRFPRSEPSSLVEPVDIQLGGSCGLRGGRCGIAALTRLVRRNSHRLPLNQNCPCNERGRDLKRRAVSGKSQDPDGSYIRKMSLPPNSNRPFPRNPGRRHERSKPELIKIPVTQHPAAFPAQLMSKKLSAAGTASGQIGGATELRSAPQAPQSSEQVTVSGEAPEVPTAPAPQADLPLQARGSAAEVASTDSVAAAAPPTAQLQNKPAGPAATAKAAPGAGLGSVGVFSRQKTDLRLPRRWRPGRRGGSRQLQLHSGSLDNFFRRHDVAALDRPRPVLGCSECLPATWSFARWRLLDLEVWAGGKAGDLYHSSDLGMHWDAGQADGEWHRLTADIVSLDFPDPEHGKLTTSEGKVWTTKRRRQNLAVSRVGRLGTDLYSLVAPGPLKHPYPKRPAKKISVYCFHQIAPPVARPQGGTTGKIQLIIPARANAAARGLTIPFFCRDFCTSAIVFSTKWTYSFLRALMRRRSAGCRGWFSCSITVISRSRSLSTTPMCRRIMRAGALPRRQSPALG